MQKSTASDKGKKGASAAHNEEDDNVVAPSKGTKLPHFSGDANTFGDFLFQLKAAFYLRGLSKVFQGTAEEKDDEEAFYLIVSACSGPPLQLLKELGADEKGSVAITKLKEAFAPSSQDRQCSIQCDLLNREFRAEDSVASYRNDIMSYRRALINIDKWAAIPDHIIRSSIITKISKVDKFLPVATAALTAKIATHGKSEGEIATMYATALSDLFTQMEVAESTAARNTEASGASAFAAFKPDHRGKAKPGVHHREKKFCTYCERPNHTADICWTKKLVEKKLGEAKVPNQAALVASSTAHKLSSSYIVDSGASSTMVRTPAAFAQLTRSDGKVAVATGTTIPSLGAGTIVLPVKDDHNKTVHLTLNNALLTPDIALDLLSTNSVVRDKAGKPTGHSFVDGPEGPYFLLADSTKIPLTHNNGLTELHTEFALHSQQKRMSVLEVHELLGHLNFEQVRAFATQANITLQQDNDPFCEACALGKSTRLSVPQQAQDRSEREVVLFHSDIVPFETPSLGGYNYAAVFILDRSRLGRVYGMKRKTDLIKALENFVTDMRAYCQTPLFTGEKSILQADSGTEYKSRPFVAACARHGIEVRYAPPKTQAKNSVAERFVRTLTEMCRTLLIAANRPRSYWFLSLQHACFLRNISPTKALKDSPVGSTPYQHAKGKMFDISLLEKWGTVAYTHIERNDRQRLDARGRKGVYVGYDEASSCALIYHPDTNRVVSAYHVQFDKSPLSSPKSPLAAGADPFADEDEDTTLSITSSTTVPSRDMPPPATPLSPKPDLPPPPAPLDASDTVPPPAALVARTQETPVSSPQDEGGRQQPPTKRDPKTMKEAMESDDADGWLEAFHTEVANLETMGTYTLVRRRDLPPGTRVLGCKTVWKTKCDENGKEIKKKCRIVAKGFMEDTDGQQTFAPVSNYSTIRTVLSLAASLDLELYQCDIKSAYLMANLPEDRETYMEIPEGLPNTDEDGYELVWKLKKSLYGLASAGRLWSEKLSKFMESQGFRRSHSDPALYMRGKAGEDLFLITTWVDDLIIAASRAAIDQFMRAIDASDLDASAHGDLHFILNMQIRRDRKEKTITLTQATYIHQLVETFNMQDAKRMLTPLPPHTSLSEVNDDKQADDAPAELSRYRELVGSLNYIANTVRADISFAVSLLSRFLANPRIHHWNAAIHCLKYLKGTADLGITYHGTAESKNVIVGYTDSDWAGDKSTGRSTSGYVFMLNGAAISWRSQRQPVVATSTAEAELISASLATQEAIHLRMLLGEMGLRQGPIKIYEDNQPCIKIAENPINSDRTKHIHVRYFFVRERVQRNEITLEYMPTDRMLADCLTKSLEAPKVVAFRKVIMGTPDSP